jgi:hypothetical protein
MKKNRTIRMYDGANENFYSACSRAGIPATRRQYKKWLQGRGAAYAHRNAK